MIRTECIDPVRLHCIYNILKLHFSQDRYDIRKYGLSSRKFGEESFEKDRFKSVWFALSKNLKDEAAAKIFIAGNLVRDPTLIPVHLTEDNSAALKKYAANKILLVDDIKSAISDKLLTYVKNGDIINHVISGRYSIEVMTFLSAMLPILSLVDETTNDKYMWPLVKRKIEKYTPFCIFSSAEQRQHCTNQVITYITYITEITER